MQICSFITFFVNEDFSLDCIAGIFLAKLITIIAIFVDFLNCMGALLMELEPIMTPCYKILIKFISTNYSAIRFAVFSNLLPICIYINLIMSL